MDMAGATGLTLFAVVLAFNQVVIKVTNGGFAPVFAAGSRSLIALAALLLWVWLRGVRLEFHRRLIWSGLLLGLLFAGEFIGLYVALDLTTVSRVSVIFYSMPVWLALGAHFFLPGERLTAMRGAGLLIAMAGVVVAVLDRQGGAASWTGDILALLAAMGWAGIALSVRLTPMATARPETQLAWQLVVSAPILIGVAWMMGPLMREVAPLHVGGLLFQSLGVAFAGYLTWFVFLRLYPASAVASFSFLSPVFSVLMGWWLLDEVVGPGIWAALALVAVGLVLINRRPK